MPKEITFVIPYIEIRFRQNHMVFQSILACGDPEFMAVELLILNISCPRELR